MATDGDRIPFELNEAICLAPWTHTYISPQSERRLCCASREKHSFIHQYIDQQGESGGEYRPKTLEEHWNGDFLKEIRRKMLRGEKPKECQVCNEQILNLHTYKKYFNETLFPEKFESIYENTAEDGSTSLKPISFDYRISNLCDFKCRMCGPPLSSKWESEKAKYESDASDTEIWMKPEIKKKIQTFQKHVVEQEFREAIYSGVVEEIYWVGGEPLIWPIHWELMKYLVESDQAKKVFVRYNTNLSRVSDKETHLFQDLLPHFKGFNLCASIDAFGAIGEFVRTGLQWEQWKENFQSGLSLGKSKDPDAMVFDLTLTLPGLFGLTPLFDLANEWNVKIYTKTVFDFDPSIVLSPFALPREIFDHFLDELIDYCEPRTNELNQTVLSTLQQLKNRPVFSEKYPDWQEGLRKGKSYQKKLAQRRGDGQDGRLTLEEIYSKKPEVLSWWNQI